MKGATDGGPAEQDTSLDEKHPADWLALTRRRLLAGAVSVAVGLSGLSPVLAATLLAERRICIDPGHDEYGPGAVARDAQGRLLFIEADLTLEVGYRLKALLEEAGARVGITRKPDGSLQIDPRDVVGSRNLVAATIQSRIDYANQFRTEVLLSIHFNGSANTAVSGTEVYFSDTGAHEDRNRRFAQAVLDELVGGIRGAGYPIVSGGIKSDFYQRVPNRPPQRLAILGNSPRSPRKGTYPGALAEVLYLSNPQDVAFLRREDALDVIAQALREGIARYFAEERG